MRAVLLLVAFACLACPLGAAGAPGTLDPSFGGGGRAMFTGSDIYGHLAVLEPDGAIVTEGGPGTGYGFSRVLPDGTIDPTFGVAGFAAVPIGVRPTDLVRRPNGAFLVSADVYEILAFDAAGAADPSFGTGGVVTFGNPLFFVPEALAVQGDGKIVAAGRSGGRLAVLRMDATGALDATFGTGGVAAAAIAGSSGAMSVLLQPDGAVVAGGWTGSTSAEQVVLVRYDATGALDPAFGTGGVVVTDLGGSSERVTSLARQTDGKLVALEESENGGPLHLLRYDADGSLDAGFGTGGIVQTPFPGFGFPASDVLVQPDGRLLLATNFEVARLLPDGALDPTFGVGGIAQVDLAGIRPDAVGTWSYGLLLRRDGAIDVVGSIDAVIVPGREAVAGLALARIFGGTCGDGVVDAGEQCDDGNLVAGDGCDPHCCVADADGDGICDDRDPCVAPVPVTSARLVASRLATTAEDDRLKLSGDLHFAGPLAPALDPSTHGLRIVVDDAAANRFDVTLPAGTFDGVRGWTGRAGALPKWTWKDKQPSFPARIASVTVQDRSSLSPGVVRFTVAAKKRSFVTMASAPPPRVTIVLDPGSGLQCGLATFPGPPPAPACTVAASGASIACR